MESKRSKQFSEACPVDMTPLVDVTFLLLIFFMVTASFTLHRSIQMPRQTSALPSPNIIEQQQQASVQLHVDRFGGFYLATNDWEKDVVGKQGLVTCLKQASNQSGVESRLDISVDSESELQSLVDAIDAGTIAGFSSLSVREVQDHLIVGS